MEAGLNCRVGVACACRRRGSFGWEGFPCVEAGLDAEKAWPAFEWGVASSDGRGFHVWRRDQNAEYEPVPKCGIGGVAIMQNRRRGQNAEYEAWPKCRIGGVAKMQNRRRGQNA